MMRIAWEALSEIIQMQEFINICGIVQMRYINLKMKILKQLVKITFRDYKYNSHGKLRLHTYRGI